MSMARKIRCLVENVHDHGDRVYTVLLKPERPVPTFHPGQFLHLTVDEYDPSGFWPESRVFSIASSPQERSHLMISYSVKGSYTTRMERELAPGKFVWVKLPYGDFVVDGTRDVVLIAGGTGITAFKAFIEGLRPDHPGRVVLLYGARRPGLLLGLEMIEHKRKEVAGFEAVYFAEGGSDGADPVVLPGVVRLEVLEDMCVGLSLARLTQGSPSMKNDRVIKDCSAGGRGLPEPRGQGVPDSCCYVTCPVYYLAGPPVMLTALRKELTQRGVPDADIKVDAWE